MAEPAFFSQDWAAAVKDALQAGPSEQARAGKLQEYWDFFELIKSLYPASWALGCPDLPAELGDGPAYLLVQWAGGKVADAAIAGPDDPLDATYVLTMDYQDWKALHEGYDAQRTVMYRKILLTDGKLLEFSRRSTSSSKAWPSSASCRPAIRSSPGSSSLVEHHGLMQSVYEAAGGSEGLLRLAEAWHARVMADEIVSHAFSHGFHPRHSERLAAYWAEALGGPVAYSGVYGDETFVVRIHSGNGPHEEMDHRAIACFDRALDDVGLPPGRLRQLLHDYFAWATTTTMARYHESAGDVPDGLTIPRWSWNGLQA